MCNLIKKTKTLQIFLLNSVVIIFILCVQDFKLVGNCLEHLAYCFCYQNVMMRFSWNNIYPKKFPKHSMGFWSDVYKLLDRPKYFKSPSYFYKLRWHSKVCHALKPVGSIGICLHIIFINPFESSFRWPKHSHPNWSLWHWKPI